MPIDADAAAITMKIIDAGQVDRALTFPALLHALRIAFAAPAGSPQRHIYQLSERADCKDAFAVLPAWNDERISVKVFTYLPDNASQGRSVLHSNILLFDRRTGAPVAVVDGASVTHWRTAAVAALAADYLARRDARRLLFCGTGNLAPHTILAHASVRDYEHVAVWGRSRDKAKRTVALVQERRPELHCVVADDLESAAREADVISCATGAKRPLILGEWVRPGTHTDFLGNHEREARECDSELIAKARVYMDSRANVLNEAGEILIPLQEGRIGEDHLVGELAQLCRNQVPARRDDAEVTLFKSVGTALSDLVAANLVLGTLKGARV